LVYKDHKLNNAICKKDKGIIGCIAIIVVIMLILFPMYLFSGLNPISGSNTVVNSRINMTFTISENYNYPFF